MILTEPPSSDPFRIVEIEAGIDQRVHVDSRAESAEEETESWPDHPDPDGDSCEQNYLCNIDTTIVIVLTGFITSKEEG